MRQLLRWPHIAILLRLYAFLILSFGVFRLLLFILESHRLGAEGAWPWKTIAGAFVMGVRFDLVISGYLLLLPFILLSISFFIGEKARLLRQLAFTLSFIAITAAFFISAADVPYFSHFFSRLTVAFFKLGQNFEFGLRMVMEEPRYWFGIVPFLLLSYLLARLLFRLSHSYSRLPIQGSRVSALLATLCCLLLMFVGIRGRLAIKSPIRTGTAYFSDNAFLNQLGLNPNFTLIRSALDASKPENKLLMLMPDEVALKRVISDLNILPLSESSAKPLSPIARFYDFPDSLQRKANIVFVIMESMSAGKMGRYGHSGNLTPFLDSLAAVSLSYDRCYTAGIHTYNGVYGSLFSYPALYLQHPMRSSVIPHYHSIPGSLKQHGYSTAYFTTHDGQFDNVEGFLKANDFDLVISQSDYPSAHIRSTLGVADDYMFEFSMPLLDDLAGQGKPFMATFMTASDHGPYIIPEYYSPRNTSAPITDQVVDYADWSLRKLYHLVQNREWGKNTVFVFVADHGSSLNALHEMPLNYHHSPLIFHDPSGNFPLEANLNPCGQIDALPTLMGLLSLDFLNNSPGVNLRAEHRPYIYFCADDKIGVIDSIHYLIMPLDGPLKLYDHRSGSLENVLGQFSEKVEDMSAYAKAHMQVTQHILASGAQ